MSLERTATIVSSITAFLLMIIKFFVWIYSNSISLLSSAIDSMLDMFVSIFNYFAIHNSEKPADKKFNYGRGKIEALASLFEWIIITISWIYIIYESVMKFINWEKVSYLWEAIIVMIVSVIITWLLVIYLDKVAKKTKNLVIASDALHYKTDLYSNAWILFALDVIYLSWFHYIDAIVWTIVWIYIISEAYKLIKKWILLLLDVALPEKELEQIKAIIEKNKLVNDYHFLKTRSSWKFKFLDVHLVFHPLIKLIDAHRESDSIEDDIRKINKSKEWVFNIHLDPYDDSALNEEKCNVFFDRAKK